MKKKITRNKKIVWTRRLLLLLLVILIIGGIVSVVTKVNWKKSDIKENTCLDEKTKDILEGYTTIALFGVDNRSNKHLDSGNSDSILLCSIHNRTKEVKLVSVYRDTIMDVNGDGKLKKCNYAYNHGGADETVEMLNRNLDLNIKDYAAVDFNALAEVVDAFGGVKIELSSEEAKIMNSGYIGEVSSVTGKKSSLVKSGLQVLDGVQAVAYCRIRYTSGDDFKRAQRQRVVIQRLVTKTNNIDMKEITNIIDKVFPDISTNLKLSQAIMLASKMKDYQIVYTTGFPFNKCTGQITGIGSSVVPCTLAENAKVLHKNLYDEENYVCSDTVEKISQLIENKTGYNEQDIIEYKEGY